jgi:uncharacterized repeat protein (TIGR02543 family)
VKNRIISISLAALLALSVGLIGCVGEEVPETMEYNLTISSTEGGEIVTPGQGTFIYDEGTVVPLVVFPHTGYRFVNWTGDADTVADVNSASTTITMNDNYSIMANFYEIPVTYYTLTLAANGNGSTSPSVGQHTYAGGTVVSITAAPGDGYRFIIWIGSVGTVANVIAATTTVTMNADYSIMANFEEEVTFPDPDFGSTIRGPISNETGSIFPSDLQRHTFFSGTT